MRIAVAEARPDRACREPRAGEMSPPQRFAHTRARGKDVIGYRLGRAAAGLRPAGIQSIAADATGEAYAPRIGVNHAPVAARENKKRHQITGEVGLLEM